MEGIYIVWSSRKGKWKDKDLEQEEYEDAHKTISIVSNDCIVINAYLLRESVSIMTFVFPVWSKIQQGFHKNTFKKSHGLNMNPNVVHPYIKG